jgi:hypothetical protein
MPLSVDMPGDPLHSYSGFAEEIDRKTIVAGLTMLRDICRQRSFRDLWDIEMAPGRSHQ